jgi:hypothetical protein
MTTIQQFALAIALLAWPTAAVAHHSYAMFDQTRKVTVQGTIRSLEWANPHVWVWVDVADDKGGSAPYAFETNAPSELSRFFGWTRRSLAAGDRVTIDYSPLKSGRNGGALRTITVADGRVLRTPRSDPNYITGPRSAAAPATGNEVK